MKSIDIFNRVDYSSGTLILFLVADVGGEDLQQHGALLVGIHRIEGSRGLAIHPQLHCRDLVKHSLLLSLTRLIRVTKNTYAFV